MKTLVLALMIASVAAGAQAQGRQGAPPAPPATPTPPAAPAPPAAPREPAGPPPAAVNVVIEITVIDEGGPQLLRKTISLTTTDRQEASARSEADLGGGLNPTLLNIDATPLSGLPSGKIRLRVSLDYIPPLVADQPRGSRTRTRLQFALIVNDGKTVVASNTSDPATDRRVRVEVTATIPK